MSVLRKLRNGYVLWHAKRISIPSFTSSRVVRKKVVFAGKVQKVGFRMELDCIARRLKLTGWVRNLKDGSVEAELQGEESQIDFLIQCMCSLKRASVQNKTITDLPNKLDEDSFAIAE